MFPLPRIIRIMIEIIKLQGTLVVRRPLKIALGEVYAVARVPHQQQGAKELDDR